MLADEINRTTPRTQSSLLEAMSEGRGLASTTRRTSSTQPFIVIATQNPLEHFGTYPLPESQMDRFLLRMRMGYPSPADERRVVTDARRRRSRRASSSRWSTRADVARDAGRRARACASRTRSLDYAQRVVAETRRSPFLALGVSPRGFQAWYRAAQARALVAGRDYAVPDDFKEIGDARARPPRGASPAAAAGEPLGRAREEAERVLADLLERVPVPS